MDDPSRPDAFEFSVLSLPAFEEFSLILSGDELVYYDNGTERVIPVAAHQWQQLWQCLLSAGAWHWQRSYGDGNTLDGDEWSLTIIYQDREIVSGGANGYPAGFQEVTRWVRQVIASP